MKDYLLETIKCLENYKECQAKLKSKKEFLKKLKGQREHNEREVGIKGITYDEAPAKTNKVTSIVEKIAIKNIQMELDLEEEIDSLQYYVTCIELGLLEIKEEWRNILELKYIEGETWEYVARKTGLSDSTCRRYSKYAIKALVDRIQGEESYIDLPLFRYIYIEKEKTVNSNLDIKVEI